VTILFFPDAVECVLTHLPSIASALPASAREGVASEAYPGVLRRTDRELCRWIANTHQYPHLADLVLQLERVLAAGCAFDDLLRTRSREQFVSLTAEMLVADDLLQRGYAVERVKRSGTATPDLHVEGNGVDIAVEVYSPRELLAVDGWVHDVLDLLNYIDLRGSYRSRVDTRVIQEIPPANWQTDPWAPARMLDATRESVLATIAEDVKASLCRLATLFQRYEHPGTPMITEVELAEVHDAHVPPVRSGSFSYPGFSGYSPEGVFRGIVDRAVRKAKRRQVDALPTSARALAVYMMGTQIAADIVQPPHLDDAGRILEEIDPRDHGVDVIAFIVRALPTGLAAVLTLADDTALTRGEVEALFGGRSIA
jgi:hypothetical protein